MLSEWEHWSAEVLESHLSYPVLAYFRSQHGNQSWLAALTTMLDTSALVMVGFDGWCVRQAQLTFAMARHAVVDLAQVFSAPQPAEPIDRLPDAQFGQLITRLHGAGMHFEDGDAPRAPRRTSLDVRAVRASAVDASRAAAAAWVRETEHPDNWEGAPWTVHKPGVPDDHFRPAPERR